MNRLQKILWTLLATLREIFDEAAMSVFWNVRAWRLRLRPTLNFCASGRKCTARVRGAAKGRLSRINRGIPCTLRSCESWASDCGGEYTGYGVSNASGRTAGVFGLWGDQAFPRGTRCQRRLARILANWVRLSRSTVPTRWRLKMFFMPECESALKLGQVRGVAMLAAAAAGLEVAEYSPLTIKSAVVGYGRAEKQQVQHNGDPAARHWRNHPNRWMHLTRSRSPSAICTQRELWIKQRPPPGLAAD